MFDCLTLKRAGLKSKRLSTDFLANNLRFVLYKIYTFQLLRNIIDNFFHALLLASLVLCLYLLLVKITIPYIRIFNLLKNKFDSLS